ncbi:hypothetical protein PLESTF_000686200 [Pleodorina starrii]|nr:hypothetical protein PLESTF_000686200 [Pleodorina starrii]
MAGRRRLPGGGPLQFLRDTLLGPPAAETKPHPAGGGAGGSAATSPRAAPTTVDYAAAAREQMHEVATHGSAAAAAAAAEPPMAPASEGRTPSGGPASFLVDTLLGPEPVSEPGPGSYVPPSAAVVGAAIAPPVEPLTYIPPPAPVPLEPLQPLERLEPEPSSSEDLAPPVPVPMETYAGGMAADEPEYPEVPYESLAPSASAAATSQQVTERAAAAMAAADAALEVSTASMEAATAAIEAAAAAAAAASAAQEAATDAAVAAVDLGGAAEEAEMPSTPPGRRVAAVPDYAREYGRIGAGGEPGVGPGGGSASDLEAAESGAAAPPPSSEGEEEEKLDLPDFSGLDIDKHGRCGKPAELPPFAKEYGKIGAGGPTGAASDEEPAGGGGAAAAAVHPGYEGFSGMDVTSFGLPAEGAAASGPPPSTVAAMAAALPPERMPAVPAEVGPAAVSEQLGEMHLESFGLTPTTKAEVTPPEAAAAAAAAEPQGEGRRGDSGVPGVFGALKRMVESELGGAGAPAEVAGGKAREAGGVVVAEPAGPTAIDA